MKKYKIAVDWEMFGEVKIEANSLEEAIQIGIKDDPPIPLPIKRLKIPTRTAPDGEGRELYEIWEMRIHKRVLDIAAHEKALRYIMRIPIPKDVHIEMQFID